MNFLCTHVCTISSTLRDICGLFKTGSKLRKAADSMIELSDAEDLELLKGFNKTAENVCSADFLKGKKLSLNQCYKIESPKAVDLSKFRDLVSFQKSPVQLFY